jgi:hypothetical protein
MADISFGIKIPDSKIAREAAELVRQHESEMLFNHSVRVYVFGAMKGIARTSNSTLSCSMSQRCFMTSALSMLTILRQSGLKSMALTPRSEFLRRHGRPRAESGSGVGSDRPTYHAWHPRVHAARNRSHNAGVLMDVIGIGYDEYTPEQRDQVIAAFPRGDFKNEFIQVQTHSAMKKPQTTFGTVNVEYIECYDPTFRKPNVCARIRNTPWRS